MSPALRLGDVEVRPAERQVLVGTRPVHLGSRAFDVLIALMQRADRVVGKDELLDLVWPGVVVEENNLQVQISALRKLLGAHAIATVPGRGYRLTLAPEGAQKPGYASPPTSAPPSTAAPLFGRADDLRAVRELVPRHPLVSLTGTGGIGKTRLARAVYDEVQADFAGGAYWVEFAPLSDPSLVPGTMAQAVGLKVGEGRSPLQALVSFLREESVLLVLDNCEHLVESIADCVSALVRGGGRVRILATSQEPLKTEDEVVYRLGTLAVGAPGGDGPGGAVELFVTRALAADPRLRFDADAMVAAAEICRHLDGIPLALELAAARVPLLGLEGLRSRLKERFNILTGGARTVMRRHQTLRATLEWSHGLLSMDEQRVFRRLGVFVGSFPLALAQRVAADDTHDSWAVLDLLGHLVDKSLVMVEGTAEARYYLLETTRQYALEQLALADETRQWLRRHAEATRDYLGELDDRHNTAPIPVELFLAELDNLRSALEWTAVHDRPLAVALIGRSNRVWQVSAQLREALMRCRALLPLPPDLPARERALFLLAYANAGAPSFSRDALEAAREAEELFTVLGDDFRCLTALRSFIFIGAKRCDDDEVAAASARARGLLRPDTQHRLVAALAAAEGLWHLMRSRDHKAIECSEWQRSLYRAHGDEAGVWMAEANLAYAAMRVGDLSDAIVRLERAIAEQKRLTPSYGLAPALSCLAWGLALKGDLDRALQIGREAVPYARREGDLTWILHVLAVVHSLRGDPVRACEVLGFVVAELARLGMMERPIVLQQQQEVWDRATAKLGADEVERCKAAGARASEDEAVALALGNEA